MAHIDKHPAGSFCWIELATTDQKSAKNFYGSLFGWDIQDSPMGPGEVYTIFKLEGRDAAAAYTLRPDQREQGVPPHWMPYIAVENADTTAAKAAELGGTGLCPPFDVMEFGRMTVLKDPTGAHFCIWQPKQNPGIGIAHVDGTLCWADLSTPDAERASDFYRGLFGWRIMAGENDKSGYLHIKNGEHFIGGIPPAEYRPAGVPPHWLAYFQVHDVDTSTARAKQMGANVCVEPMTMEGVGRWAAIADPQGAVFALFKSAHE